MRRLGKLAVALAAAIALVGGATATAVPGTTAVPDTTAVPTTTGVLAGTGALAATAVPAGTATAGLRFPEPVAIAATAFPGAGAAGWALGTEGARTSVWHTGDGGVTWRVQWRGVGNPLVITATNTGSAWVLLACATRACGRRLIATTDGGAHWRQIATLPATDASVQFGTAGFGVTTATRQCSAGQLASRCPGQVLISRDGGARWTTVLTSPGMVWVTADAAGGLWAALALPGNSSRVRFLTSKDEGRTWIRLGTLTALAGWPFSAQTRVSLHVGPAGLEAMSVFDLETCAMHGCGIAGIYQTGDGGQSWHAVSLPDLYPDQCGPAGVALSVAHDGTAWAAIQRNAAACGTPYGELFRAVPGQPWRSLPPWQLAGATALDAVSADVAWAIGGQGTLSRTIDGGEHWTQLLPAPSPAGDIAAFGACAAIGGQDATDSGAIVRYGAGGWKQVAELPGIVTRIGAVARAGGTCAARSRAAARSQAAARGRAMMYAASYAPGGATPWRLWTSGDGGSDWALRGPLPGGAGTAVEGPWLTADGHGFLLAFAGGTPWEPQAGGTGPVSEWQTSDGGATWHRIGSLRLGSAFLSGPATFAYQPGGGAAGSAGPAGSAGWAGWIGTLTPGGADQVLAVTGSRATVLPGITSPDGLQLTAPGTGFAWSVDYSGPATTLTLYWTADDGRHWSRTRLILPGSLQPAPRIAFSGPRDGWLVAGQATLRTGDGGRTWAALAS